MVYVEIRTQMPPKRKNSPDDFQTPPYAVKPLIPYLNRNWVIWECAEGQGYLSGALKSAGFKVISTGIEFDFLKGIPNFHFDAIVTNPPYSLKDEFIEKAFSYNKPLALLLPLTALEGKRRQEIYKKYGIQLLILNKRINFITPSGKGSGSWFATMWLTHGLNLPKDITFAEI
jgi:hypothetical protein